MVWGGISLEGRTDLYRLDNGTLTAIRYQDEILRPIVRPYAGAVGPGFLLVHNNAQPHVKRVCRQFLENEGIDTIDWPTGSPDLNPIEHLWDIMFLSIRRNQVALQTVQELSDALIQIWEEIPQDTIRVYAWVLPCDGLAACPGSFAASATYGTLGIGSSTLQDNVVYKMTVKPALICESKSHKAPVADLRILGVLWQMPIELYVLAIEAQGPLQDVGPS
ncbi:hypothetical protein NFI96_008253, partial [Prochilodus magdalenae]